MALLSAPASGHRQRPSRRRPRRIGRHGRPVTLRCRPRAVGAVGVFPGPDEFSFRVLKNKLTDQWADREAEAAAAFGSLAAAYAEARPRQDLEIVVSGAGRWLCLI